MFPIDKIKRNASLFIRTGYLLYFILGILLLPAIWYSIRTNFALIDDYNSWMPLMKIADPVSLQNYIHTLFSLDPVRYRPIFDLYNLITWFLFRENFALHHLARFVIKFAIAFFSLKAIRSWYPPLRYQFSLYTFAFLVLFFFMPNNPESRLAPQELLLVFGAAWFLFAFTRLIIEEGGVITHQPGLYVSLLLAYLILNGSKEAAIGISGISLLALVILNRNSIKSLAWLLPFAAIFVFSFFKSASEYQSGSYGIAKVNLNLIRMNFDWYSSQLFLLKTNPVFLI